MINKIEVYIKSRNVYAERNFLGISGENDVETLEFVLDNFIEGQAYIELEKLDTEGEKQKYFIKLDKKDDSYVLKVKSSLLDVIQDIKMQLVIEQEDKQVFKSKVFYMQVLTAINATSTIPEQYPTWVEQLEQKVQEIDDKLAETTQLEELLTRSETARQEQEESRVETEKLRVEAEEKREQNTAKAINDINGNVVAQDRIVYKDNKWQFEKNAAIHTIDKTLLKQTSTSTNGKYRYQYFQIKNNVATAKDKNPGVCNIFSLARDGQTYNCEKGFTAITGVWNFYDEGETLEEFITKIENVDIVVTYITKEPIYEYCTSAQSEVLDKLYNNFKLQKGVNNIIVESENGVGVNLELEYMQDLQTKLNLLEAMCVSNASQEV